MKKSVVKSFPFLLPLLVCPQIQLVLHYSHSLTSSHIIVIHPSSSSSLSNVQYHHHGISLFEPFTLLALISSSNLFHRHCHASYIIITIMMTILSFSGYPLDHQSCKFLVSNKNITNISNTLLHILLMFFFKIIENRK